MNTKLATTPFKVSNEDFDGAAQLFKVLADPTRLRIIAVLRDRGSTIHVEGIVDLLGTLSQSAISYHLKLLMDANVITVQKSGNYAYYVLQRNTLQKTQGVIVSLASGGINEPLR